jgi:hypothetical protein
MKHKKIKHLQLLHYIVLGFILAVGLAFVSFYTGNPDRQFSIIMLTGALYVLWGLILHAVEGDLHPKIVVEYLLIAVLAVIVTRGALYR